MPFQLVAAGPDPESIARLRSFYAGLYTREFPDADERESLENMENYLRLRASGWYGPNNYHIIFAISETGETAGGVIADYLAVPNCGVIEFVVVDPGQRGQGLGKLLIEDIALRFAEDAHRAGHRQLDAISGEVNDPYRRCEVDEHLDGFARLQLWHHFGFRLIDFPYVQPPLSAGQEAVTGIALMLQPLREDWRIQGSVPSSFVETLVREFQIWAMRLPDPDGEAVFGRMREHLRARSDVALLDMRDYAARPEPPPFKVVELRPQDPRFGEFAHLYERAFPPSSTAIDVEAFAVGTHRGVSPGSGISYEYMLWGLQQTGMESRPGFDGFASFFSLPHCGFGGYVCLSGALQGKGHLRHLLRLMERRLLESNPHLGGWYVECAPGSRESMIFQRLGFTKLPVAYLQPRLPSAPPDGTETVFLDLLYKPFGRIYAPVSGLPPDQLNRDLVEIFSIVYQLSADEIERASQAVKPS